MKTKGVILGLVAFVFAIGSAFTTVKSNDDAEIQAKASVTFNNGTSWQCITTDKFCTTGSGQVCRVIIDLASAPDKTVDAHSNSPACNNDLVDDQANIGLYVHSTLPDDARDN